MISSHSEFERPLSNALMALSSPALTLQHQDVRTCQGVWLLTATSAFNVASGQISAGMPKTTTCRFSIIPVSRKHHAGSRGRVHPGGLVEAVRRLEGPCGVYSFRSDTRSGVGAHGSPLQSGPPIPLCFFRWKNATESSVEDRAFPLMETR